MITNLVFSLFCSILALFGIVARYTTVEGNKMFLNSSYLFSKSSSTSTSFHKRCCGYVFIFISIKYRECYYHTELRDPTPAKDTYWVRNNRGKYFDRCACYFHSYYGPLIPLFLTRLRIIHHSYHLLPPLLYSPQYYSWTSFWKMTA